MKFNPAILLLGCTLSVPAQSFQNLNFEQANPGVTGVAFSVPVSSALPDWTVTIGGTQQSTVGYNAVATGAPSVSLIGPGGPLSPLDGNYSVLLQGSFSSGVSLSQTATIPAGAQSILFDGAYGGGVLALSIGNQAVPFVEIGSGPGGSTEYAANISAWADDPEQLTFSALQDTSGPNNWELDDIAFSPNTVAEPSPFILAGVGGIFLALRRWCWNR